MTAFWRAWSIWVVSVMATATMLVYTALHPLTAQEAALQGSGVNGAVAIVFIGAFATVGAFLAWKRPRNPIGWLLSGTGLTFTAAGARALLAAGSLGRRSGPGRVGRGLCIRAHHHHVQPRDAEPGRRNRASREH